MAGGGGGGGRGHLGAFAKRRERGRTPDGGNCEQRVGVEQQETLVLGWDGLAIHSGSNRGF